MLVGSALSVIWYLLSCVTRINETVLVFQMAVIIDTDLRGCRLNVSALAMVGHKSGVAEAFW